MESLKEDHSTEKDGIGVAALPIDIRNSKIFTALDLSKLASVPTVPFVDACFEDVTLKNIIQYYAIDPAEMENELHYYAQELLNEGKINEAWQVLLALN